jgi:probable rRNA maturation factor
MSSELGANHPHLPTSRSFLLFDGVPSRLRRAELRGFAARLQKEVACGGSFCCLFADDHRLRSLNRDFLGKDYATDVLSFPSPDAGGGLGDIAISVERAREQAGRYGHDVETEIKVLMLHGVLHLLGHDHESDRGAMRRTESRWRRELGLPAGLIERVKV